jgi:hypothetical protein
LNEDLKGSLRALGREFEKEKKIFSPVVDLRNRKPELRGEYCTARYVCRRVQAREFLHRAATCLESFNGFLLDRSNLRPFHHRSDEGKDIKWKSLFTYNARETKDRDW